MGILEAVSYSTTNLKKVVQKRGEGANLPSLGPVADKKRKPAHGLKNCPEHPCSFRREQ